MDRTYPMVSKWTKMHQSRLKWTEMDQLDRIDLMKLKWIEVDRMLAFNQLRIHNPS